MTHELHGDTGLLRRYLIGSSPESERERLERALLADENLFEELLATEDELIDEYVCGRLPDSERAGFLQYLRALPDHEQRLAFAEALRSLVAARPAEAAAAPPVPVLALAAAALLVMLGGVWSFVTITGLQEEVEKARAELAHVQERPVEPRRQGAGVPGSGLSPTPIPSFLLGPGTLRSGGATQVVSIPPEDALVELRLDLGSADYGSYRAVVCDANARELMSLSQLSARTQEDRILVVLHTPSVVFGPGDYYVSLLGEVENGEPEPVARYDFRISTR